MTTRSKPLSLLPTLLLLAVAACDAAPEATPLAPELLANRSGNPHVEPELFAPGIISTERNEGRISFTADGNTAYFNSTCPHLCIRVSHRTTEGWTTPVVASFSGTYPDLDPFITADGSRLFFSSIRPVDEAPRGDWDTWMAVRTEGGWSDPIHLGTTVNSRSHELYPTLTDDGTLYFASSRPGGRGGWDLYRSRLVGGEYQEAENLPGSVNTEHWEFNPQVSPDGRRIVFGSMFRPENLGDRSSADIYVTHLHSGEWTAAENLGAPVNTVAAEFHPTFSADGKDLFFARNDPSVGHTDLFRIEVSKLGNRLRPGFTLP